MVTEAISRSGIEQIYPVARLQKSVASTGAARRRWSHEFSTKLASTRRGSTHWSTQKIARLLKTNHNLMASASSALFRRTATDFDHW
jgi:hypothetical protein